MAQTVLESLKGINAYPIPLRTITETATREGLTLSDETTQQILTSKAYNLCVAELLLWLSYAPDVSQGGQSYSFTDEQRELLRNRAQKLLSQYGDEDAAGAVGVIYGYKGSRL